MLSVGLEHPKIGTRLIDERFASVMGECERDTKRMSSIFKVIGSAPVLVRMFPNLDLIYEENTTRRSWN